MGGATASSARPDPSDGRAGSTGYGGQGGEDAGGVSSFAILGKPEPLDHLALSWPGIAPRNNMQRVASSVVSAPVAGVPRRGGSTAGKVGRQPVAERRVVPPPPARR